jgi:uncharacterized membrane protein YhaH (DUF805 family)
MDMAVGASLGHNLRRLHDFSGRDARGQFWPWAIFLFILSMIAYIVAFVPVMAQWMTRIQRFVIEHPKDLPDPGPFKPGVNPFPAELMPDFHAFFLAGIVINVVGIALIAASVTRRLHDRDRTGAWALAYLPFIAIGNFFGPRAFASFGMVNPPNPMLVTLLALNNLMSFAILILLIVQFASAGTPGPNRFGPDPLATP